ncbi:MAG: hypothetical protein KDA83_12760, partial [Planctomycetales bacterium]|nr:hypothetical protein [Planctomycetales bacterium]
MSTEQWHSWRSPLLGAMRDLCAAGRTLLFGSSIGLALFTGCQTTNPLFSAASSHRRVPSPTDDWSSIASAREVSGPAPTLVAESTVPAQASESPIGASSDNSDAAIAWVNYEPTGQMDAAPGGVQETSLPPEALA